METIIFCLLVSALVLRKSAVDVPFMVRGKTPPSHELRMAELRRREGVEARKVAERKARADARRNRPQPGRDYLRALYHHSVKQAMEKREAKWLAIDPIKAERYAKKQAARAERLRERRAARERGEKVGLTRKASDVKAGTAGWLRRHKIIAEAPTSGPALDGRAEPEPVAVDGSDKRTQADAARLAGIDDADRSHEDEAAGGDDAHGSADVATSPGQPPNPELGDDQDDTVADDSKPGAGDGAMAGADSGAGARIPTQEGNHVSAATGETTTLSQTIASIEAWESETQSAMASLELSIASLNGAEVGPSVTGAIGEAREGFSTAAAAFAKAKAALEPSQQIGDMYRSTPDAGSKEFAKN
ncbi:hypothetical protein ABN034_12505 [Actinopolymorpha sp. B11F2]|uniref:hypothetical protein n=1 Tax=Actinopolymorpha sp. B11F2 TaxID=3160862 RepID=UPI0032E4C55C